MRAVVDILPTTGPLVRIAVNGETARDIEAALELLDTAYDGDDMSLVAVEGCTDVDLGWNEGDAGSYLYLDVAMAPAYEVNAPHAEPRAVFSFEAAGYITDGIVTMVPIRVVCQNTMVLTADA